MNLVQELAKAEHRWASRIAPHRYSYSLEKAHNFFDLMQREYGEARAEHIIHEVIRRYDANESIDQFIRPID